MARVPAPMTMPPVSGASGKRRLPISKPARQEAMAMTSTMPVATGSKPLAGCGSSARMETKVAAQSAAPVPTEAMNSQPVRIAAGAGEVAHANPGAEQAHGAGQQHQQL